MFWPGRLGRNLQHPGDVVGKAGMHVRWEPPEFLPAEVGPDTRGHAYGARPDRRSVIWALVPLRADNHPGPYRETSPAERCIGHPSTSAESGTTETGHTEREP